MILPLSIVLNSICIVHLNAIVSFSQVYLWPYLRTKSFSKYKIKIQKALFKFIFLCVVKMILPIFYCDLLRLGNTLSVLTQTLLRQTVANRVKSKPWDKQFGEYKINQMIEAVREAKSRNTFSEMIVIHSSAYY